MKRILHTYGTNDLMPKVVLEYDDSTGSIYANGAILGSINTSVTLTSVAIANVSINTTLDGTYGFVKATAGAGGITVTLPSAVNFIGLVYKIMKVDAIGVVTISTTSAQTINSNTSYLLSNQWQFVELIADDTGNWIVTDLN